MDKKYYIVITSIIILLIVATATFFILQTLMPKTSNLIESSNDKNDLEKVGDLNVNKKIQQPKGAGKKFNASLTFFKKGPGSILVTDPLGRTFGSTCDGQIFGTDIPEEKIDSFEEADFGFYEDHGITELVTIFKPVEGIYKRTFSACDESSLYDDNKYTILSESFLHYDGFHDGTHNIVDTEIDTEIISRFMLKEPEVQAPEIFEFIDEQGNYLQRDLVDTPYVSSIDSIFWLWAKAFRENDIDLLTNSFGYTMAEIENIKNDSLWPYNPASLITSGLMERKSDIQIDFNAFMVIRDKSNPDKESELKNVAILIVNGKIFNDGRDMPGTIDSWRLYPSNDSPKIVHSIDEARDIIWAEVYPIYRK